MPTKRQSTHGDALCSIDALELRHVLGGEVSGWGFKADAPELRRAGCGAATLADVKRNFPDISSQDATAYALGLCNGPQSK